MGTDVSSAQATINSQTSAWQVNLSFTGGGQSKWADLTREAYDNGAEHQIAVVLDNEVVSAPGYPGRASAGPRRRSPAVHRGRRAKLLANQLKFGALPLTFSSRRRESISATLGAD